MNTDEWDDDLYPTPERRLMFEIGWLDLWHALRETNRAEHQRKRRLTELRRLKAGAGQATPTVPPLAGLPSGSP